MKLLSISKNPLGLALAVLHWVIAVVALLYIPKDNFSKAESEFFIAVITLFILFALDLPAIIPLAILFLPFYFFGVIYFVLVAIAALFVITLQCLVVGQKIRGFFDKEEKEILTLKI
jgi:hypothetical protein